MMKLTTKQLKLLIKEELRNLLESDDWEEENPRPSTGDPEMDEKLLSIIKSGEVLQADELAQALGNDFIYLWRRARTALVLIN